MLPFLRNIGEGTVVSVLMSIVALCLMKAVELVMRRVSEQKNQTSQR